MVATSTSSSSPTMLIQELFIQIHSRKLLLHNPLLQSPTLTTAPPSSSPAEPANNSFDANVVMVLSVLLCALICSLGLNSIIRCALRCSSLVSSSDQPNENNVSARLANTGIKKKALKTFPTISYTSELKLPGLGSECAICLSEFAPGERVRVLPECNHGFHVRCIDKWLNSHSSCPTCRRCLIETCQKIVGCSQNPQPSTSLPPPAQETTVRISPLEREGFVRNHGT